MAYLCKILGHKAPAAFSDHTSMGGGDYLRLPYSPYIDGIKRKHFSVWGICPRCGEEYQIGFIHAAEFLRWSEKE